MIAFLEEVDKEYGGMDNYVVQELGFSNADLEVMRRNLQKS